MNDEAKQKMQKLAANHLPLGLWLFCIPSVYVLAKAINQILSIKVKDCPECKGSGYPYLKDTITFPCPTCKGKGYLSIDDMIKED